MTEMFTQFQQQGCKRIAKAWIKGICPKKRFWAPYQSGKSEGADVAAPEASVPGWWPPTSLCIYKEPDHVTRQRMCTIQ